MHHRSCPVCQSFTVKPSVFGGYHYRETHYDIVRCRGCGFFFVDPLPDENILMEVYRGSEYFDEYIAPGAESVSYLATLQAPNEYDETTLECLSRYCASGRLLDVGCAGGRFLARAKQAGYDAYGLEPNARMAAHARDALGLEVCEGTLGDAREMFGPSFFEVIHLGDVLEHLLDLHGAFETISFILKSDGLLLLQQPMTYHRTLFNLALRLNMAVKRNRYSGNPPLHLWEFTPSSLRRVLKDKGFDILYFRTFESRPKSSSSQRASLKQHLASSLKVASCFIAHSPICAFLELGDRALVAGRKS